jgi:hypothetical protein
VNASLTLASVQSKMSDNAKMIAARIANIAISCRGAGDGSGAHLTLHASPAQGRPGGPPTAGPAGPIRMTTWRSDRRWRFPWRTQPRAAHGQLAANIADGALAAAGVVATRMTVTDRQTAGTLELTHMAAIRARGAYGSPILLLRRRPA